MLVGMFTVNLRLSKKRSISVGAILDGNARMRASNYCNRLKLTTSDDFDGAFDDCNKDRGMSRMRVDSSHFALGPLVVR